MLSRVVAAALVMPLIAYGPAASAQSVTQGSLERDRIERDRIALPGGWQFRFGNAALAAIELTR